MGAPSPTSPSTDHRGMNKSSSTSRGIKCFARWRIAFAWLATGSVLGASFVQMQSGTPPQIAPVRFEDIAASSGVQFILRNSATPHKYQIEPMVAGIAVFDYN